MRSSSACAAIQVVLRDSKMSYKEEVGVDAGLGLPADKPSLGRGRELYRLNARETAGVAGQTELRSVRNFWRSGKVWTG